jgi:hypothetical protein
MAFGINSDGRQALINDLLQEQQIKIYFGSSIDHKPPLCYAYSASYVKHTRAQFLSLYED